jgi:hypothetical protein
MTVPESIITRLAATRPSRLRAPARDAEVRSVSDNYRDNACPKIQNGPKVHPAIGVRAAETIATCLATPNGPIGSH